MALRTVGEDLQDRLYIHRVFSAGREPRFSGRLLHSGGSWWRRVRSGEVRINDICGGIDLVHNTITRRAAIGRSSVEVAGRVADDSCVG
jgi:hypothetical protein